MNILITGNLGYIGSVLTSYLFDKKYSLVGYDIGYYEDCNLFNIKHNIKQIKKDIRDININDLTDNNIEIVIHMAALSNDPLGEFNKSLTYEINYKSTLKLANLCKKNNISKFVFLSTQSMYGISKVDSEIDEDKSEKKPITEYAKTKWKAEKELFKLANDNFCVSALRPSSVFGVSPRLRTDIVYNNLISNGYTFKKINIHSDGTPWRPVIHIRDVCNAILAILIAPKEIINKQSFNVGIINGNYTVKKMAETAKSLISGSEIIYSNNHKTDERTYKVSFNKILKVLKKYYHPKWDLVSGGNELIKFFDEIKLSENILNSSKTNRLKKLKELINKGKIDKYLRRLYKNDD